MNRSPPTGQPGAPGARSRTASPEDTYAAVAAALRAGAGGVVLSRKYSEMRLENLVSTEGRAGAGPVAQESVQYLQ